MVDEDLDQFPSEDEIPTESGGPEVEELDDEMRDLISQLDDDAAQKLEGDVSPPMALTPIANEPEAEGYRETPPAETLVPQDIRKLDLMVAKTDVVEAIVVPPEPPVVDLRKQFEQMDSVAEEILLATRADRQETEDIINVLKTEIDKAVNNNQVPNRGYLDNIVKALEVKASINMTAVKAMEAKAKLLAATKAANVQVGVNVQNQNNHQSGMTDSALVDLLNESPLRAGGEDEY
jgi:hypothetical protein